MDVDTLCRQRSFRSRQYMDGADTRAASHRVSSPRLVGDVQQVGVFADATIPSLSQAGRRIDIHGRVADATGSDHLGLLLWLGQHFDRRRTVGPQVDRV